MLRISQRITYDRTPDPAWVEALAALSPPSEQHSYLHLAWEPGDAWEPVERWVIWQIRPPALIDPDERALLAGPSPRSTGHYCGGPPHCLCPMPAGRWVGGPESQPFDRRTWELFRETGGKATRYWVVQGTTGGHLRRFTRVQTKLMKLQGLPAEPPDPGALDYAEPDARTWAALAERDRMRIYWLMTDFLARSREQLDAEERAGMLEGQRRLFQWLRTQTRDVIETGGSAWQKDLAQYRAPVGHVNTTDADYDREEEAFLSVAI